MGDSIGFGFVTAAVNPTDYHNPLPINFNGHFTTLYPNSLTTVKIGFTPYRLFTDDGILTSNTYSNMDGNSTKLIGDEYFEQSGNPNIYEAINDFSKSNTIVTQFLIYYRKENLI